MFLGLFSNFFSPKSTSVSLEEIREQLEQERAQFLLAEKKIAAAELIAQHPPNVENLKKKILFEAALRDDIAGSLTIERFSEFNLPERYTPYESETKIIARKGYFQYEPNSLVDDWHLNFADRYLFGSYGTFLFAQDEIQVAEHPALASVREMMLTSEEELKPLTFEDFEPTPVLIRGVQRTININTKSIYGQQFARSDDSVILESIKKISPPTVSNILAIEAPRPSENTHYDQLEILLALRTAYSGFRAVVGNSIRNEGLSKPLVIHTGNWGCGAYGGNRQLMTTLQMMAAKLAGVHQLVFHCGLDSTEEIEQWHSELTSKWKFHPGVRVNQMIQRLVYANFLWGTPDGN